MDGFSTGVLAWWGIMSVLGLLNIGLLLLAAGDVLRRGGPDARIVRYRRWQLFLSAGYVLGCASRSLILRADVQRFSMIDHFAASVFVGRSVATVAEVMFVAQWALLLGFLSRRVGNGSGVALSWVLVPLILVAETCSWYAVLTTNYLGNAVEESLWAFTAALFMLGLATLYRGADPALRRFLQIAFALGLAYVLFMITVDVPMYVSRWWADQAAGRTYLTLSEGLGDAMRWTVTGRWEDWRDEIPWMSLYFSFAVWMSLALIYLPRLPEEAPERA